MVFDWFGPLRSRIANAFKGATLIDAVAGPRL